MAVPVFHAAPLLARGFERQVAINVPVATGAGAERNAIPCYDFPRQKIVNHRLLAMPLRTSSLRSLGAHCNVFAAESMLGRDRRRAGRGSAGLPAAPPGRCTQPRGAGAGG
jgi:hypothetical protein